MAKKKNAKRRGALALWLNANGKTLTAFAKLLTDNGHKASVQHISNLVHGHTKPGREIAVAIEQATSGAVKVESWG